MAEHLLWWYYIKNGGIYNSLVITKSKLINTTGLATRKDVERITDLLH